MKLEQQVVSLDLAKRLKELGCKQDGIYSWFREMEHFMETTPIPAGEPFIELDAADPDYPYERLASAFTVAELGNLLKAAGPEATIKAYGDLHNFRGTGSIGSIGMLWLLTEPDRLAKMLIYLIENSLMPESLTEKGKE